MRRDHQVGVLTPPKLERLIREKDASLGPAGLAEPLQFGFVALEPSHAHQVVFRIMNLVTEPVSGVSLTIDASLLRDPSVSGRSGFLSNATLQAGETKEVVVNLGQLHMYRTSYEGSLGRPKLQDHRDHSLVSDQWVNLIAHLTYRDADGFIRQRDVSLAIGS